MRLRCAMCSGSSSSITEREPRIGPSRLFASPTPSVLGVGGENLLDVLGIAQEHPRAGVADAQW